MYREIYAVVARIPRGQVATYGQVARLAGLPRRARFVGYALSALTDKSIPWHRVINARGEISLRSASDEASEVQRLRLEAEGVVFDARGRIDLLRYQWDGSSPLDVSVINSKEVVMVIVIASIRIKAGRVQEFLEIFKSNVPKVKEEDGCIEYAPTVDVDAGLSIQHLDDRVVTIVEKWQSLEALEAHLAAPHMLEYREKVKDLVEEVSLKVLQPA